MALTIPNGFPITIPHPLAMVRATLVRRYARFLAEVELDGRRIVSHCINTGTMEGLPRPGATVWLSKSPNESRKLAYTWEAVEIDGAMVGVNTLAPNRIVRHLLLENALPWYAHSLDVCCEKRLNEHSRIDFWMRLRRREIFLEVKNCHLVYPDGRAYFPDSVSDRATKHLGELVALARRGHRAEVLFTIQHPAAASIRPADVHDPAFAAAARQARDAGVRFRALIVRFTPDAFVVEGTVPVDLKPYSTRRVPAWRAANKQACKGSGLTAVDGE